MIDDYARILEAAAGTGDKAVSDAAVTKLILHLRSAGRLKMLPDIARELRKVAARRNALRPRVEVAHKKEEAAALRAAARAGIVAPHASVNRSLIHGWRGRKGDTLVDRSAKRALLHIYQQVTG